MHQWPLMPFWLGEVFTQRKSFERNPVLRSRWANERGLHTARVVLAHRLAAARRRAIAPRIPADDRKQFDRDGVIVKPDFLPSQTFAELVAQVRQLRDTAREMVEGDAITRRIALCPKVLAQIPAVRRLFDRVDYRDLIRYVGAADAAPTLYLQTVLTRALDGAPSDPQTLLHADTFHPTVKAWLYLNDAAAGGDAAAPLVYVPGSHRLTPQRLAWERRMSLLASRSPNLETRQGSFRIGQHELAAMGLPAPHVFEVPRNTLVIADTFGFHARGTGPQRTSRVEIFAYARRNPFLPWSGLDLWSIGSLGFRKPLIQWYAVDRLAQFGLGRQRWQARPATCPFDCQ
jgi:hypothetical protein